MRNRASRHRRRDKVRYRTIRRERLTRPLSALRAADGDGNWRKTPRRTPKPPA